MGPFDPIESADEAMEPVAEEQLDLPAPEPAPAPAPKPKKKTPSMRRKTLVEDELPPDYEYPKRYRKPSLDIFEEAPELESPDVCPECGSRSIEPRQYSLWSLIPSLILLLPIFFPRKKWICRLCRAVW